eukprot:COSAG05_NODE_166_length_15185_cov_10.343497_12_plen_48_part_00
MQLTGVEVKPEPERSANSSELRPYTARPGQQVAQQSPVSELGPSKAA